MSSFALETKWKRSQPGFEPGSTTSESNVMTAEPRGRKLVTGADIGWPLGGLQIISGGTLRKDFRNMGALNNVCRGR